MKNWLWQPIDIAGLVFFRIAFGILGFVDLAGGFGYYHLWVGAFDPDRFQFRYYGFEWLPSFPEPFMSLYFLVGMALALAVAVGWRYRWTAPLFALFFSYYFLLEKAHYLNHGYLFCWISWVMAVLPAWRAFSVDVWQKPQERTPLIPRWSFIILPFLMGVVYFFGGIAKLNADWMLNAMPLKLWMKAKHDLFLIGPLLQQEWVPWIMSWGGALLDLSIVFLMLGKRTRKWGFIFAVLFHLSNHLIFNIGIFPYLSIILTSLYFGASWPGRMLNIIIDKWAKAQQWALKWQTKVESQASSPTRLWQQAKAWQRPISIVFVVVILIHVFLPLRHWLYPGDVAWTEEGHRYAWRMMLRSKRGRGHFILKDLQTGEERRLRPQSELLPKQARKMWTHPDMILQYAHHLRDQELAEGKQVAIYAHVKVKLNDGKYHPYVDSERDLAQEEWSMIYPSDWILPEEKNEEDKLE